MLFFIIFLDEMLPSMHCKVYSAISKIDFSLAIIKTKRSAGLNSLIVSEITVCYSVTLRNSMVGVIEVSVLSSIAPLEKPTIPVFRQWKLGVEMDGCANNASHVTISRIVDRIFFYFRAGER